MRIYGVLGSIAGTPKVLTFVGTKADAHKKLKVLIKDVPQVEDAEVEVFDVPTDKAGLIEWLNTWTFLGGGV